MTTYRATPDNPNTHITAEPNRLEFTVHGTQYSAIKIEAETAATEFFKPGMYDTIEYRFGAVCEEETTYGSIFEKPTVLFECDVVAILHNSPAVINLDASSITTTKMTGNCCQCRCTK